MGQWLRRSARAIRRPSPTDVITATLFGAALLLLAAGFYGLAITDLLLMYLALTLGGYALVACGIVMLFRSDLRAPQQGRKNSTFLTSWYNGVMLIVLTVSGFLQPGFKVYFPAASFWFRIFWFFVLDGACLVSLLLVYLVSWARKRRLTQVGAAPPSTEPVEMGPAHVSRRTLLVGGVVVALELAGVGWLISKRPTLIPQQTFAAWTGANRVIAAQSVAWAPDGRRLAAFDGDSALAVWDTATGATLQKLPISADNLYGYAWSPDGSEIAIGAASNVLGALAQIQMWDVVHQRISQTYLDSYAQRDDTPTLVWRGSAVGFVSDTIENSVDTVYFWDAQANSNRKLLTASNLPGLRVFSPDGRYLAALTELGGGVETPVYVWDTQTGELVITHIIVKRDTIDFMQALAWSPDGRRLAIGASFNRAIVFDALTGAHWQTLQGPLDLFNHFADELRIHSLAWSPDSRSLAVASDDTTVRIWRDEPEGKPATVFVWAGHMDNVYVVAWSPTGQSIASVDLYGVVQIWRPQGDLWGGA